MGVFTGFPASRRRRAARNMQLTDRNSYTRVLGLESEHPTDCAHDTVSRCGVDGDEYVL